MKEKIDNIRLVRKQNITSFTYFVDCCDNNQYVVLIEKNENGTIILESVSHKGYELKPTQPLRNKILNEILTLKQL